MSSISLKGLLLDVEVVVARGGLEGACGRRAHGLFCGRVLKLGKLVNSRLK